jgi:inorganic pyrophosphatase
MGPGERLHEVEKTEDYHNIKTTSPPFFTSLTPDPMGVILRTEYQRFNRGAIDGLCKLDGDRLDLLAFIAEPSGKGYFRQFIVDAKERFSIIAIWQIWNPWLTAVLERYGFIQASHTESDGDELTGYIWTKSPCVGAQG